MGLEVFDNYECDGQLELTDCTSGRQLTHLSLFTGIGGLDIAAEWAGFQSVGQCEWADYPTKVLEKHWPDVPRWRDIRTLNGASFYERTNRRTVDVISGGFPCQPFSTAGKQRGKEDDRYLWPEMVRVIKELRPTWVVGENVAGIINMALDTVLSDLEAEGYTVRTFVLPACGVNVPHQRYRTAIVAHSDSPGGDIGAEVRRSGNNLYRQDGEAKKENEKWQCINGTWENGGNGNVAYANGTDGERSMPSKNQAGESKLTDSNCTDGRNATNANSSTASRFGEYSREVFSGTETRGFSLQGGAGWWTTEPGMGRVANGIPHRVDRLKCLGNAVVPAQFYPIFQAIADIELHR